MKDSIIKNENILIYYNLIILKFIDNRKYIYPCNNHTSTTYSNIV